MDKKTELIRHARALPKSKRKEIIASLSETDLHGHLKELFESMEPDYLVEVTHGRDEYGKDLVLVKRDNITVDVIAVVVKRGDIRAKTAGDVDEVITRGNKVLADRRDRKSEEIESQIRQAAAHPAELKSVFHTLPASKVMLVLAGDLGKQARRRLAAELMGNYDVVDLDWLVRKFTEFYPQLFFEGKVVDFVQDRIYKLETQFSMAKTGKNLSEYFVEPIVAEMDAPIDLSGEQLKIIVRKRKLPFSHLRSVIGKSSRILLLGDPGTGKSGALAKLAVEMLGQAYSWLTRRETDKQRIEIPMLATAKEILETTTFEEFSERYFGGTEIAGRFKIKALMVDALDEVPAKVRSQVIERAQEYARLLECGTIIASRKVDVAQLTRSGFDRYELMPFEFGQAMRLFEKVVSNQQTLEALKVGLENIRHQIPMVPLSLMLLLELVEQRKEVPASITELYDRFLDAALGRWDSEKGIEVLFEYLVKKRFLGTLARELFLSKGRLEVLSGEFEDFVKRYADLYAWQEDALAGFMKEMDRAGILTIGETVTFRHRSFLEYFSAFEIHENREEIPELLDYLVELYFDDLWSNVAFFYIGLRREIPDAVVDKILNYPNDGFSAYVDKFLLGRLIQAGWYSPSQRKLKAIERALEYGRLMRDRVLEDIRHEKHEFPRIFADFLVLLLGEMAFGSLFLAKESRALLERFINEFNEASAEKIAILLWAMRRLMDPGELRLAVDKVLAALENSTGWSAEAQARMLILLLIIKRDDKPTMKVIRRRLQRLARRAPEVLKALVPPRGK